MEMRHGCVLPDGNETWVCTLTDDNETWVCAFVDGHKKQQAANTQAMIGHPGLVLHILPKRMHKLNYSYAGKKKLNSQLHYSSSTAHHHNSSPKISELIWNLYGAIYCKRKDPGF
eukprot:1142285-Pelagomonas_calceolata.AAC.6